MVRRKLFTLLAGLPFLGISQADAQAPAKKLKIMMKSAWGSDDPTRASFVFAHGLALAEAGHDVQIFLTGEATYLMRKTTVDAIMTDGWPPHSETLGKDHYRMSLPPRINSHSVRLPLESRFPDAATALRLR